MINSHPNVMKTPHVTRVGANTSKFNAFKALLPQRLVTGETHCHHLGGPVSNVQSESGVLHLTHTHAHTRTHTVPQRKETLTRGQGFFVNKSISNTRWTANLPFPQISSFFPLSPLARERSIPSFFLVRSKDSCARAGGEDGRRVVAAEVAVQYWGCGYPAKT